MTHGRTTKPHAQGPSPAARASARPQAQLSRATLLFADIQGSTQLVQHLDPEEAAELLGPLLRVMETVVRQYEGFPSARGDGIMAVFGPPMPAEDHAMRGCLAALDILERAAATHPEVRVRIGVHVGDVFMSIGADGRPRTDEMFGSAIHIAARLEQTAEPGTACLSTAAHNLVRGAVHAVPLPAVQVKGIDEPVGRMRLVARNLAPSRGIFAPRGLAGFVDRMREMNALRAAAARTDPDVRIVQIVGEPGIGKSRFLQESLSTGATSDSHLVLLVGNKLRKQVPFDPVAEWLRHALHIPHDPASRPDWSLSQALAAFGTFSALDIQVFEQIVGLSRRKPEDLADLAARPAPDIADPIARLVRGTARRRRVLIVCEDVDQFDAPTWNLLPGLIDRLSPGPVLVLTSSRAKVRLAVAKPSATTMLRLGPLPEPDARKMLLDLGEQVAMDERHLPDVLAKAGGNPFFLEEVFSLAKQTAANDAGGRPDLSGAGIPDRVESVIVDRLARLPDEHRHALRVASVIGYDLSVDLLGRLLGTSAEALRRVLIRLQSEHLVYESAGAPDPRVSFRHALTREVAYNSLLRAQRRALHAEIAALLETEERGDPMRRLDELCQHCVRGGLTAKAIGYLQDAAGLAAERGARGQAADYLRQALGLAPSLPDAQAGRRASIEILLGLRTLAVLDLRYVEALQVLDEAERLAAELEDETAILRVRARRLRPLNVLGRLSEAVASGEELRALCRTRGNPTLAVEVAHDLGQA